MPIQRTLTYQVIDENDPSNPVTIQPNTDLLNNGQVITGNQGSNVPNDATTAYDAVKNALEAKGYVISSKSSTVPTIFGPDNTALTIYVTHKTINVSTPDQWPSTSMPCKEYRALQGAIDSRKDKGISRGPWGEHKA